MGLLDLFRFGRVLLGTAKAVKHQRQTAVDLRALPPAAFVAACVEGFNAPAAPWRGEARPPAPDADALAQALRLPAPLREFYRVCDGFASDSPEFPTPVLGLRELRPGEACAPPLSARLRTYWAAHGNDAAQTDRLAVLPPDSLLALVTADTECELPADAVDTMMLLCSPGATEFTVIALTGVSDQIAAGSVLDVEGGSATRYDDFTHWLATRASLFSSL